METIGKYKVTRKLGEGATSEVYLCHDPFANREVAIKVVFPDSLTDVENRKLFRKLFITEASLAGKLSHPHIVQIFDAVVDEGISYVVMEYVDGGTLEPHCNADALEPIDKIVEIIFKCTRALDFANRAGVIHRDIKPANILLHGETDIKISDFGSALVATSMSTQISGIGSPAYMSPQQIKEHPLTLQTDIYSLGVVMYQLLTGQLPFQATNNFSMMYQITNVEPPPPASLRPEISPAVEQIVRRAMQKELEQRYPDWDEFSDDLAAIISSEQAVQKKEAFADSEKFNILRDLPFFSHFGDAELWEVMRISGWEYAKPGKALMFEGQTGDFFCLLASGEVKVIKQGKLLNILNAGECFGEMAYISRENGSVRSADVVCLSESRVITIRNDDLDRASDVCRHKFDRAFMAILVERLSLSNTRLIGV
ncbi:MAG: serine/threonine protein kinase [Betaproteobacteria bacterium]|nr:MAG: serine/threonine protein kinase [Betaproteobacteria bacterium]